MVNTKDITLIQGDTTRLIIPVVDNDDSDEQFESELRTYSIEFGVADSSGTLLTTSDVTAEFIEFGKTKPDASQYERFDTISYTRPVIKLEIPGTTTEKLAVTNGSPLQYQLRLYDSTQNSRVTVLRGEVTVEGAALEASVLEENSMGHYSIAESIEWRVDYSSHDDVPSLRWDALDASAAVLVTRANGEEVLSVTDDDYLVDVGGDLVLTIPGDTLPDAGVYKLQAVITFDDGKSVTVPDEPDLIRVTESPMVL